MSSSEEDVSSKRTKLNDDAPAQVIMFEYTGRKADVPKNVTHIRFHPSVVAVDGAAFERCTQLREVLLNDGLTDIRASAFYYCISLQRITIPSSVLKISMSAFMECGLREVVLNEGLKMICRNAFYECKWLEGIVIPSTVDDIHDGAFMGCRNLRAVVLTEGIKMVKSSTFRQCTSLRSVELPSTISKIGEHAFNSCSSLERITIPSTVTKIGDGAFRDCASLREIVIHDEEIKIGYKAFKGCSSLLRFKFPSLSTRLNIIQVVHPDIKAKINDIPGVEWRVGELIIPVLRQEIEDPNWNNLFTETLVKIDEEKLAKVKRLIAFYEVKEATVIFELALWKSRIDQADISSSFDRRAYRIEVPGPVKDTILQYLRGE